MMKAHILLCCFAVALCIQISHQCHCPWWGYVKVAGEDIPKILCHADKYVVAKIKSSTKIGKPHRGEIRYDVIISKIITKSKVEKFYGKKDSLFAPLSSSMCGYIDFKIGKTVYVSVSRRDNRFTFNGCSFGRTANEVTAVQKKLMRGELSCPADQKIPKP